MFQLSLTFELPPNVIRPTTIIRNVGGSQYLGPSPVNYALMLLSVNTYYALAF